MFHFSRQATNAKRRCCTKVPLPSKLISLSECQLQQVNNYIQKTVGDEVITSGIGKKQQYQYNGYSSKERAGIGKYSAEVLLFLYLLCHLCNKHTLKLTPSYKLI